MWHGGGRSAGDPARPTTDDGTHPRPPKGAPHPSHRTAPFQVVCCDYLLWGEHRAGDSPRRREKHDPKTRYNLSPVLLPLQPKTSAVCSRRSPRADTTIKIQSLSARIKGALCAGLGGHLLNKTQKEHSIQTTAPHLQIHSSLVYKFAHRFYKMRICIAQ